MRKMIEMFGKNIAVLMACVLGVLAVMPNIMVKAAGSDNENAGSRMLVVYFSRAGENYSVGTVSEGNTAKMAKEVSRQTGADIFELRTVSEYPESYEEATRVAKEEQETNARPELAEAVSNFQDYDTVALGYPIWWGDMPMAVYTFLESYDFSGKKILPFNTHEGSGQAGTVEKIRNSAVGAQVTEGLAVRGSVAQNDPEGLKEAVSGWLRQVWDGQLHDGGSQEPEDGAKGSHDGMEDDGGNKEDNGDGTKGSHDGMTEDDEGNKGENRDDEKGSHDGSAEDNGGYAQKIVASGNIMDSGCRPVLTLLKDGTYGMVKGQKYVADKSTNPGNIKVYKPKMSKKTIQMNTGESYSLALMAEGESLSELGFHVSWKSSKPDVVQVIDGMVFAVGPGSAKVNAIVGGKEFSTAVKVKDPGNATEIIHLLKGQSRRVKGTKPELSVLSGNSVTVNRRIITGAKEGLSLLKLRSKNSSKILRVYTENDSLETDDVLTGSGRKYTLTLKVGESYLLRAQELHQMPNWKSSKAKVASVSEYGVVYAEAVGTAKLSMKLNGKTTKVTVKVSGSGEARFIGKDHTFQVVDAINGNPGYRVYISENGTYDVEEVEAGSEDYVYESGVAVVYFSRAGQNYGVGSVKKGNTALLAEMIADKTGAELFEIVPEKPYPTNYKKCTERAKKEQEENARPAISSDFAGLEKYDTIFIGYPIWWGDMPMLMYTFMESYDLNGKTIIPFNTHEGSGNAGTPNKIKKQYPNAVLREGFSIQGSTAQKERETTKQQVYKWLEGLSDMK